MISRERQRKQLREQKNEQRGRDDKGGDAQIHETPRTIAVGGGLWRFVLSTFTSWFYKGGNNTRNGMTPETAAVLMFPLISGRRCHERFDDQIEGGSTILHHRYILPNSTNLLPISLRFWFRYPWLRSDCREAKGCCRSTSSSQNLV
jgi:hypothetical protein